MRFGRQFSVRDPSSDGSRSHHHHGSRSIISKQTLLIKDEANRYRLFVYDRHTVKPDTLTAGTGVRVTSTQTEDPDLRLAVLVTAATAAPAATPAEQPDIVPPPLLSTQNAVEREARKFPFGVQGGVALNPELVDIGILAKFGPFFSKNVQFRSSVDFAYGEQTRLFALNADFIYSLSPNRGARRSLYFGAGPQFNFAEQHIKGEGVKLLRRSLLECFEYHLRNPVVKRTIYGIEDQRLRCARADSQVDGRIHFLRRRAQVRHRD